MNNHIKQISQDTVIYGIGYGIQKFIGFLLLPFYTRALSPSDYGILESLNTGALLISAFLNFGLDTGCSRYFYQAENTEEKGKVLFTILVLRLLTAIPALILALFSSNISFILFHSDKHTFIIFLTCISIPLSLLNDDQGWIYRFYREPWKFNIYTTVKTLTYLVFGISLVVIFKKGVIGAQLAILLSSLVVFIFSYVVHTRQRYTYNFSWLWAKKMIKLGYPIIFSGILGWLYISSDRFFLLYFKNTTEVGLYSIGATFSRPISIINMALGMSFYPFFMSLFETERDPDKPQTKKTANLIWYIYLYAGITVGLFISIFSTDIIRIVARPAYLLSSLSIPFLVYSAIARQSVDMTSLGIILKEKTGHYVWIIAITSLTNVVLNIYFIPRYSFVGAALTTLISNLINFVLAFYISNRYFQNIGLLNKVIFYFIITFILSIFFPFGELVYKINLMLWQKILVFVVALFIPFIINILSFETILNSILSSDSSPKVKGIVMILKNRTAKIKNIFSFLTLKNDS